MNTLNKSLSLNFDVKITNSNKGFALLLLWHHLFYQHPESKSLRLNI